MRKIEELLKTNESVWFYAKDEQARKQLAEELQEMNCKYLNGASIEDEGISIVTAVHADKSIAHVALMAWEVSFQKGDGSRGIRHNFFYIPKIDYKKFHGNESQYLIEKCNIIRKK